jgi:AcrR family transcriptional regulator
MPRKQVFTKDDVVDAAIQVIREQGSQHLSTKAVAKTLNASTMPIYSLVNSMQDLKIEVDRKITELFIHSIMAPRTGRFIIDNALGYIQFAKDEKELFKAMFFSDHEEDLEDYRAHKGMVVTMIIERLKQEAEFQQFTEAQLRTITENMGIVTYGLACLIVSDRLEHDSEEHIIALLNDVATFFIQRETR